MTDRIAATAVHVHTEDGSSVVFAAGESVPKWAQKLITNDAVYATVETPETPETADAGTSSAAGDGSSSTREYESLTVDGLKELLKTRELPQTGNKEELVTRLREADAEAARSSSGAGDQTDQED
ncbi:MAG: hypothetical protein J0H96_11890 [Microbacterium ginsengisoli]|jgi:hypothetical protein|nr:hypothetical protein [Microbacterium ginsengisoli]